MPVVQGRNSESQLLGSVDHLFFTDRNFGGEWYDHAGGQDYLLGNGPWTLNLDTEKLNPAPEVYTMASDILTIAEAGFYLFHFQLMVAQDGGSSSAVTRAWLEQDPATGVFAEYLPAVTYFPIAPISASVAAVTVMSLLLVGINYRYRIRFSENYGSTPLTTVADGSKLTVVRLFKNG